MIRAVKTGDDLAFAELVRAYQDIAVAYAASILGDYHLAEDVAQEAFVEVYRELASLREPAAFAGWFRTIIFKHCDRQTRRKRHPLTGLETALEVVSPEPSPHEMPEARDIQRVVREAIAALSEAERQVVLLYYMGEHSTAMIAEFLNVTANAVQTRLYAARKRLKKHMTHIEENLNVARPSSDPRFARRVMAATLPLQLHFVNDNGGKQAVGSTAASRAVEVPGSETWLIEPQQMLTEKDWDTVIGLMKELRIPGLSAEGQMTDELLERISQLDHVTYLGLQGATQLTDAGLQHLARMPQLQHLNASCPEITDRGLEVLRHLPQLKTFKLVHQGRASDAGLANLTHCQHLECVDLMGTRTGDGVVKALIGKPRFRHFDVGTAITDAGLKLFHELPIFKTWRSDDPAPSLGPTTNAMGNPSARPSYLFLNLKAPLTNQGLADLAGLDGLYALNLYCWNSPGTFDARNSAITPAGLQHLAMFLNLGWLACYGQLCTDEGLRHIGTIPRLSSLGFPDPVAGDEGFAALSRSPSIESLGWGKRWDNLTSRGFAALAALQTLQSLSGSCRNVNDEGLSVLASFPALKKINPIDVPDDGFRHVGRCEQLEVLDLMYCQHTTDVATGHIAGLSRLKSYEAWSTQITGRSLAILGRMRSLERVLIYDCAGVTNAGLASLAGLPRLREVVLEALPKVTLEGTAIFPPHVRVNLTTGEVASALPPE